MFDKRVIHQFLVDSKIQFDEVLRNTADKQQVDNTIWVTLEESSRNSRLFTTTASGEESPQSYADRWVDEVDAWATEQNESFSMNKSELVLKSSYYNGSLTHVHIRNPKYHPSSAGGFGSMLNAASMDTISYSKPRALNYENVYDAVLRFYKLKDSSKDSVIESLKSAGFTWTVEEVQDYEVKLLKLGVPTPKFKEGLANGNVIIGARIIASIVSTYSGFDNAILWIDESNYKSYCIEQWLNVAKLILGKE